MKTKSFNLTVKLGLSMLASTICLNASDIDPKNIIDTKCATCHTGNSGTELSRISEQRKTPEGWWMTISRMEKSNGLVISSEEKKSVVKYLADTQGLNPQESDPYRYVLEQLPNVQETPTDSLFVEMCNRCHSSARVGLQRRTKAEWENLVDFHMGYFPSIEYHALARDRDWYDIAKTKVVDYLDKNFSLDKKFELVKADYSGEWIVYGHRLGEGDYSATLKLTSKGDDKYSVELDGSYMDGKVLKGSGSAIVYSGYEYRATLDIDGVKTKQVIKLNPKTMELSGAMFEALHPEESAMIKGSKVSTKATKVLGIYPKSVKAGSEETITIVGTNLNKDIKLSSGLKVNKVLESSKTKVVLSVVASNVDEKLVDIKIGKTKIDDALVVYKKLDGLKVFPDYAIARVGDGGGKTPKQHAIFEAVGYLAGKDGKIGTADDISIGQVDASWSIAPFDEQAKHDEDVKYVGTMASNGRFIPSFAGPNPKRKYSTNNAGNIKVIATYKDGDKVIEADSHMMVTVQKWVNPPIN